MNGILHYLNLNVLDVIEDAVRLANEKSLNEASMKRWRPILSLTAAILLLTGCAGNPNRIEIPKDAAKMEVDFSWEGTVACTHRSPEIRVSGIPQDTHEFKVELTNVSAPKWNQGGGKVANDGSGAIPSGALTIGYNGPCPPPGERYQYEFSVMALDEKGTIIGFGKSRRLFPPK
jgi:phosphatidylethanolamine-binding protein (PEBP) family uncharacterized protein